MAQAASRVVRCISTAYLGAALAMSATIAIAQATCPGGGIGGQALYQRSLQTDPLALIQN